MKNCHEVRSKSWQKLGQNFTKLSSSWTCNHKIIYWDQSSFREKCVRKSCRFHGVLQLSCWELSLNHLVSWWKNGLKLRKKKKFSILRKISKLWKFQISKQKLQSLIYWWPSFTFWHVLMNCDPWHLILTKKSKFDFSIYIWLLISWLQISSINPMKMQFLEPGH